MASNKRLSALINGKTRLSEGETVYATFPPNRLYLFDRKSERALLGIVE